MAVHDVKDDMRLAGRRSVEDDYDYWDDTTSARICEPKLWGMANTVK